MHICIWWLQIERKHHHDRELWAPTAICIDRYLVPIAADSMLAQPRQHAVAVAFACCPSVQASAHAESLTPTGLQCIQCACLAVPTPRCMRVVLTPQLCLLEPWAPQSSARCSPPAFSAVRTARPLASSPATISGPASRSTSRYVPMSYGLWYVGATLLYVHWLSVWAHAAAASIPRSRRMLCAAPRWAGDLAAPPPPAPASLLCRTSARLGGCSAAVVVVPMPCVPGQEYRHVCRTHAL